MLGLTLREFQLGKFPLLALLAHLKYRDGIKLGIKPWEGGYCREGLGGGCSSRRPSHLKFSRWLTSPKFRVTTSLIKLVFSIEVRYILSLLQ